MSDAPSAVSGVTLQAPRRMDIGAWVMRLAFLAVGSAVMIAALGYGLETPEGLVGPGMVPFAAGLVAVVATLVECLNAFRKQRSDTKVADENVIADADEVDNLGRTPAQRSRAVLLVFATILLTVVMSYVIGLLLALSLMVVILIAGIERKPWWIAGIAGVGAFLFGWGVFGMVLNVPLPTGMLGLI